MDWGPRRPCAVVPLGAQHPGHPSPATPTPDAPGSRSSLSTRRQEPNPPDLHRSTPSPTSTSTPFSGHMRPLPACGGREGRKAVMSPAGTNERRRGRGAASGAVGPQDSRTCCGDNGPAVPCHRRQNCLESLGGATGTWDTAGTGALETPGAGLPLTRVLPTPPAGRHPHPQPGRWSHGPRDPSASVPAPWWGSWLDP